MKKYRVIASIDADHDLIEIAKYIASFDLIQAEAVTLNILNLAQSTLSIFPSKHQKNKGYHMWPH